MSPFKAKVIEIVRMVPTGKVVSYGQVALYAGVPRGAREVGSVLKHTDEKLPWWRVVNNAGRISIEGNWDADKSVQKKLLEAEGVQIAGDFTFPIERYRWIMPIEEVKKLQLPDEHISKIIAKFSQNTLL